MQRQTLNTQLDNKASVRSWLLYDFANSAFATTVMAGFFPLFFKEYWSAGADAQLTTSRLGLALSISGFSLALLSPFLGVLSDQRSFKKLFCFLFMLLSCLATLFLSTISQGDWLTALITYCLALVGFSASIVFYDSTLPLVSSRENMHRVSSLGYGFGYLGGGILFLSNVIMYLKPEWFGLESGTQAVQVSFIMVALWWLLFSVPFFKNIHEPKVAASSTLFVELKKSLLELQDTLRKVIKNKNLVLFLLAYWLYIDGVFTVMTMAVDLGLSIGFKAADLITALLIVQFMGFPCGYLFAKLAKLWGSRIPILLGLGLYCFTVIFAAQMKEAWHFYFLAFLIGGAQGGIQALSRSLFCLLTPAQESGAYFGLFNLIGRFASVIGPVLVGYTALIFDSSRLGILSLILLFGSGAILLWQVKEPVITDAA